LRCLFALFLVLSVAGCSGLGGDKTLATSGAEPARHVQSHLYLSASGPAADALPFRFSGVDATRISVALYSVANGPLQVSGSCDGAVAVRQKTSDPAVQSFAAGAPFAVTLAHRSRGEVWLEPSLATRRCTLSLQPQGAPAYQMQIEREEWANPALAALDSRNDICNLPDPARLTPLQRVYYAPRTLSLSCDLAPGTPRLLGDARDAFNAKVEALTGAQLSQATLDAGDPLAPIDFAHAPQLDVIWISYLNLRADYSGYMISRMLAYHAARGATVRILVTDVLMLPRDRAIYEDLAARYPNVQLQLYRWDSTTAPDLENPLHAIHRDQHVKVFATLARNPALSRFITGGRNLHDPFVFDAPRDLSDYPFLRDYDVNRQLTLSFFLPYQDFEIEFSGNVTVRALVAQLSAFWLRDADSQQSRHFSTNAPGGVAAQAMRHFVSVPYADDYALEQLFIELIDAAQESILFTAPFLNLTPTLDAALRRAAARGVDVRVIARMDIDEPAGAFSAALNQLFFEELADLYTIIGYDPAPRTLHTKIYVFDGELAVVGSTNMNQRSFLHDTENGMMILDPTLIARLQAVIEGYAARGVVAPSDVNVPVVLRALMSIPAIRRLF